MLLYFCVDERLLDHYTRYLTVQCGYQFKLLKLALKFNLVPGLSSLFFSKMMNFSLFNIVEVLLDKITMPVSFYSQNLANITQLMDDHSALSDFIIRRLI